MGPILQGLHRAGGSAPPLPQSCTFMQIRKEQMNEPARPYAQLEQGGFLDQVILGSLLVSGKSTLAV